MPPSPRKSPLGQGVAGLKNFSQKPEKNIPVSYTQVNPGLTPTSSLPPHTPETSVVETSDVRNMESLPLSATSVSPTSGGKMIDGKYYKNKEEYTGRMSCWLKDCEEKWNKAPFASPQ